MINGDVPRSIRYMLDRSGNREVEELGPISPNGRWLVLTERRTAVDNNLYLYDIKNHRAIDVTTHKGDVRYMAEGFSEDSDKLVYFSRMRSDDKGYNRYWISNGKHEDLRSTVLPGM